MTNATPRVIILTPNDLDTTSAEKFGRLVTIYEQNEPRPSIWDSEFIDEAMLRLHEMRYSPYDDYLLIVGNMVPIVSFVAAVCSQYRSPMALLYDAKQKRYVPQQLGRYYSASETNPALHPSKTVA